MKEFVLLYLALLLFGSATELVISTQDDASDQSDATEISVKAV